MDRLQGKAEDKFRKNPRKIWWNNLKEVVADGDHEVSFVLERAQASFLALFATGYTPIYPCHVSAQDMRTKPVGTGPFKFVEFKGNESVKLVRNADYWRKGHPYVDAIDWRIVSNRSTRVLAFIAGEFDMTFSLDLTVALVKDIKSQLPQAICELQPTNNHTNLIVNRDVAPPTQIRARAGVVARRKASTTSSPRQRQNRCRHDARAGGPGHARMVATLPGYGADVEANRAAPARSWRASATG
jgi:peptide/nickel transport system substrate-binding protein